MSSHSSDICGLILAGGKSSRMGKEKGKLDLHGMPQKDYLVAVLNKFCKQVFTSIGSHQNPSDYHNPIPDAYDFNSPLNGIMSAFSKAPDSAWLCVAVDMPYVDELTIKFLVDHRDKDKMATCFFNPDEKLPEPLLTIWEPGAWSALKKFHAQGRISPREFLAESEANELILPDKKTLTNLNSPADLDEFIQSTRK